MKRALLAGLLLGFLCYLRGRHGVAKRVPIGHARSPLRGHRCVDCGRAIDPDYVDPFRRQGPRRAGWDELFWRRKG